MDSMDSDQWRKGSTYWPLLAFLLGFVALLIVVSWGFLLPALDAARHATTPAEKRQLAAYARLVLAITLTILVIGLFLTLRVRRFFQPRPTQRTRTDYPDAWAESARRLRTPPPDDDAM